MTIDRALHRTITAKEILKESDKRRTRGVEEDDDDEQMVKRSRRRGGRGTV